MPDDKCAGIDGPAGEYCESDDGTRPNPPDPNQDGGGGLTEGASDHVKDLAQWLLEELNTLLAPGRAWAPEKATDPLYAPFLWLGQHMALSIFVCVVAVCALTAWQGAPRLKQMGYSTSWTLVAIAGMASVPGAVMLFDDALSKAFQAAFSADEGTLFGAIKEDIKSSADADNPLGALIITSLLCVALAFAALVFLTRNPAVVVFVCMAPLVLASLARGGDATAVQAWGQRLLGLMMAPFALLLLSPFVPLAKGNLVLDAVLLVGADVLMLRMVFHGIPYFGPRLAGAARSMVERRTSNRVVRGVMKAGSPDVYEQENVPRGPRLVATPGRAMGQDSDVLAGAYGLSGRKQPGRLTTGSAIAQSQQDAERSARVLAARRDARAAHTPRRPVPAPTPAPGSGPGRGPATP